MKFFNKTSTENIRDNLVTELNIVASKFGADPVGRDPFPDDFNDRQWGWREQFYMKYFPRYEENIGYFLPHDRYWLDQTINMASIMVWNLVNKTIKAEHKKFGEIPDTPLSRKQGKNSIEAVAEYFANTEAQEFEDKFS